MHLNPQSSNQIETDWNGFTKAYIYIWLEFFVGPFFQLQMSRNWRYIFGSKWPKNQKIIFQSLEPPILKGTLMKPKVSVANKCPKMTHFQYCKNAHPLYSFLNFSITKNRNKMGPASSKN